MSKWLVVGLSGVTNGGKTTLTNKLLDVLPTGTCIIKQDDYFFPEDDSHHVPCPGGLQHHNWDIISSLDMERMIQDVKDIVNSQTKFNTSVMGETNTFSNESEWSPECKQSPTALSILLLDGFLLFGNPQLTQMCNLHYFLTLTHSQCWERRKLRIYEPPDPPGYFDHCVWPMYEAHLKYIKENVHNVTVLDGSVDHFPVVLKQVISAAGLKSIINEQNGNLENCEYM